MEFLRYPQLIPALFNVRVVRTSTVLYHRFILSMDRSPGFGSTARNFRPFETRFRFGSGALHLNLAAYSNSPARSTKSTWSLSLPLLVNTGFQVLFHSPPGVLFTFPSRYYSLSVTWSYLAFWDGPHFFRQDFSCPDVLRITLARLRFRLRGFHPLCLTFPDNSTTFPDAISRSLPLKYYYLRFGLLRFRSPLLSESLLFSFPPGT